MYLSIRALFLSSFISAVLKTFTVIFEAREIVRKLWL